MQSENIKERAQALHPVLKTLLDSLPNHVQPSRRLSFGGEQITTDPYRMNGWEYDWHDKGPEPPPWSDWSDKDE